MLDPTKVKVDRHMIIPEVVIVKSKIKVGRSFHVFYI